MKKDSLEYRIFRASLIYIMLMLAYAMIYRFFQQEYITVVIYIFGLLCTWLVHRLSSNVDVLQKLIIPWVVFMVVFAIFMWFKTGGFRGGGLVFFTVMLVSIIVVQAEHRIKMAILFVIIQSGLVLSEHYLKHLPIWGSNDKAVWDFVLLTFINVSLVWMMKSNYDNKEDKINQFSLGLRELHRLNVKHDVDLDEALSDYLKTGAELLGMRTGMIVEIKGSSHFIRNINTIYQSKTKSKDSFSPDEKLINWFKKSDDTLYKAGDKGNATPELKEKIPDHFIGTPLLVSNKVFGVLMFSASTTSRKRFEEYEVEIIELMALNISHLLSVKIWREEQLEADKALYLSEKRFKSIYDYANVGICVCDTSGQIIMANRSLQELYGVSENEMRKYTFYSFSSHGDLDEINEDRRLYEQIVAGEIEHYAFEKKKMTDDGRLIHISKTVSTVKDEANNVQFTVIITDDITNRKLNEEKINNLNKELAVQVDRMDAANKELESFSYSVSHDLRAPLRAIDGFSKIILEEHRDDFDDESKRLLGVIIKNSGKMAMLIDDLLAFSRISRMATEFKTLDTQELVNEIIEEQALDNNIFDIDALPNIKGEKTLMKQVFSNLIGNAVKFSSKSKAPKVVIKAVKRNEVHEFEITDNGVGFNMAYYNKVFGVFQRLHTEEEFAGTGVGLAIVQKVILKHNGKIWAKSEDGKGASFFFSIPK